MASVLKTDIGKPIVGSNPTSSANWKMSLLARPLRGLASRFQAQTGIFIFHNEVRVNCPRRVGRSMVIELLTVLGLGAVELWAAIPMGFALGLHPLLIVTTATLGATLGAVVVLVLGKNIRNTLSRLHHKEGKDEKQGYIYKIWMRFGVIGLGLLAPLLVGAPLGTAIGITLGAPAKRLILWIIVGIVFWVLLLTITGILGLAGIRE